MKIHSEVDTAQPKKTYTAPQLIEHGTIEKITGDRALPLALSGVSLDLIAIND